MHIFKKIYCYVVIAIDDIYVLYLVVVVAAFEVFSGLYIFINKIAPNTVLQGSNSAILLTFGHTAMGFYYNIIYIPLLALFARVSLSCSVDIAQLKYILELLGTPCDEFLNKVQSDSVSTQLLPRVMCHFSIPVLILPLGSVSSPSVRCKKIRTLYQNHFKLYAFSY